VFLTSAFTLGQDVAVADLPAADAQFDGTWPAEEGWGRTVPGPSPLPCPQQTAPMQVLTNEDANAIFAAAEVPPIWDEQLAVYDPNMTVTPCNGDGGGGLFCQQGGLIVLCGINSWGVSFGGNCDASYPFVTTRISSYLSWIANNG
jgi:hypothetical protein